MVFFLGKDIRYTCSDTNQMDWRHFVRYTKLVCNNHKRGIVSSMGSHLLPVEPILVESYYYYMLYGCYPQTDHDSFTNICFLKVVGTKEA